MPASESNNAPFVAFIDDYFVECDEHLTVAHNSLLALEPSVNQTHLDRSLLDELFRSFHSLKGLSAMVGVGEAEQLAHQMESYLSALRKEQVRLTAEGLETLILGVNTLEQVISARRVQRPPPNIEPLLTRIAALLPGGTALSDPAAAQPSERGSEQNPFELSAEKNRAIADAVAAGARAWRFTFVPSPALAERGVNVSAIRQRLKEIGELIHAAPAILPGGQIAFAFYVTSRADEATFASWREDQLTYETYEPPPVVEMSGPNEPAPPISVSAPTSIMPSNVVRVDLARLDELMRMVGELVISRAGSTTISSAWAALHPPRNGVLCKKPIRRSNASSAICAKGSCAYG